MKDSYGREIKYLRISVTDRCNLRCRYCMPEEGVFLKEHENILSEDEMVRAVRIASELGVSKVRITGGEPLVKKNILSLSERIAAIPGIEDLAVTTNGTMLLQLAKPLKAAGIKRLNISLDTLKPDRYRYISRTGELAGALAGLDAALVCGFDKIKINCVLIGGFNNDEIRDMAELTLKYPVDVRFIELMPMVANAFGPDAFLKVDTVTEILPEAEPKDNDGVARLYALPGAFGNIGLISPVSNHFCSECNRIRLTADGKLKPCLHSGDEYSIKGLTEDETRDMFIKAIAAKPQCHKELSYESLSDAGRTMNAIGG